MKPRTCLTVTFALGVAAEVAAGVLVDAVDRAGVAAGGAAVAEVAAGETAPGEAVVDEEAGFEQATSVVKANSRSGERALGKAVPRTGRQGLTAWIVYH